MIELEIDGRKIEVPEGSMVMDAATKLGLYVPHFCYHKKLSIAANCRMCLVEVEKAPKPLPACATPVTAGMKVFTVSEKAKQAQKSVMEFLLINHPLDCPICDQGGECQLQDLAVGYGPSASRYTEEKRVVFHKSMGPLISAEEMSRCIHCTRCVRFGQEIAGVMELGMAGRGEHSEIMSFVGNAVESELSGNMIDICPVGALTSKPFRYSARTWELSRKRSVSPHDSIGANIVVQSKNGEVKRVVPFEQEEINECWISDRDRFSYEALHGPERLTTPMIRDSDGSWREAGWGEALEKVATALKASAGRGPNQVRTLCSPNSTLEELALAGRLTRALKSDAVDFRPRLGQPGFDQCFHGTPTLGMTLAEVSHLDRILVVGSFLRADHPLLAQRIRQAVRHGGQLAVVHAVAEDLLMPVTHSVVVSPAQWVQALASDVLAQHLAGSADPSKHAAILLGNSVLAHPQAAAIWTAAQALADRVGCRLGFTVEGANGVGGYLAKAMPLQEGPNAAAMFATPADSVVLVNLDPTMDCGNPHQARAALKSAKMVVALTPFKDATMAYAHVVLPIAPYTETSGSYVNCEGRLQVIQAVVRPPGAVRPGWKVLRVLGTMVGAENMAFESSEEVRQSVLGYVKPGAMIAGLSVRLAVADTAAAGAAGGSVGTPAAAPTGFMRIADVPIYRSDAIVRHAPALQQMRASAPPKAWMNPADMDRLGLVDGMRATCDQGHRAAAVVEIAGDHRVAPGVVRLSAAHGLSADLGPMIGPIEVEAA